MSSGSPPEHATFGVRPASEVPEPPLQKVDRLLAAGEVGPAVLYAYLTAEEDLRRAFGLTLPPEWTHREFVARYLRPDMGRPALLLPRLHVLFEPVRYGRAAPVAPDGLRELVAQLYEDPALRRAHQAGPAVASLPAAAPRPAVSSHDGPG